MTRPARIVLLNGAGSVGKSSIARALQAQAERPLLHVEMDAFLAMMPERLQDHPDTLTYRQVTDADGVRTEVVTGSLGAALLAGMRQAVAVLAGQGFDLVVDDVWLDGEPADYRTLLARHAVFRVGLTAPLAEIERREAARGDRQAGLARAQADRVHRGVRYDMMLDTATLSPDAAAARIARLAGL